MFRTGSNGRPGPYLITLNDSLAINPSKFISFQEFIGATDDIDS